MLFGIDYVLRFINIPYRNIAIFLVIKILADISYPILWSYLFYGPFLGNSFIEDFVVYPS